MYTWSGEKKKKKKKKEGNINNKSDIVSRKNLSNVYKIKVNSFYLLSGSSFKNIIILFFSFRCPCICIFMFISFFFFLHLHLVSSPHCASIYLIYLCVYIVSSLLLILPFVEPLFLLTRPFMGTRHSASL